MKKNSKLKRKILTASIVLLMLGNLKTTEIKAQGSIGDPTPTPTAKPSFGTGDLKGGGSGGQIPTQMPKGSSNPAISGIPSYGGTTPASTPKPAPYVKKNASSTKTTKDKKKKPEEKDKNKTEKTEITSIYRGTGVYVDEKKGEAKTNKSKEEVNREINNNTKEKEESKEGTENASKEKEE